MAAGAVYRYGVIVGVNTGFHEAPFCRVRSAQLVRQGRAKSAASLGREQFLMIREVSNSAKWEREQGEQGRCFS